MPLSRPKTVLFACLLAAIVALTGCAAQPIDPNTPPITTDQQQLQNLSNEFDVAHFAVDVMIATGYLAKGDAVLQKKIEQMATEIGADIADAKALLASGKIPDFHFYLDKARALMVTYLGYESQGEVQHKLSNPTTRPALRRGLFR